MKIRELVECMLYERVLRKEDAMFMVHKVNFADDDMQEIKLFIVYFVGNTLESTATMCLKPSERSFYGVYGIKMISHTDVYEEMFLTSHKVYSDVKFVIVDVPFMLAYNLCLSCTLI